MFGRVRLLVSFVFGGLLKCASKVVTRVVVLGIKFIFSNLCVILSVIVSFAHLGSMFSTDKLLFSDCIMRSTYCVIVFAGDFKIF